MLLLIQSDPLKIIFSVIIWFQALELAANFQSAN